MKHKLLIVILALAVGLTLRADTWEEHRDQALAEQKKVLGVIDGLLSSAEVVELVSLDPFPPGPKPDDPGEHVGPYRVRRRAILKDKELSAKIAAHLNASIAEETEEAFRVKGRLVFPMKCFLPQHGFRVIADGKEVYILVGNICHNAVIWGLADGGVEFQLSSSWYNFVEDVFLKAGLPASEKKFVRRGANQALVPTPASVTPAADAPVAPDAGAAHL